MTGETWETWKSWQLMVGTIHHRWNSRNKLLLSKWPRRRKVEPTSEWFPPQVVFRRDSLMPLLASVVSGPISKPFPACIFKFYVSYCCIIDVLYHSTNLEIFLLYISLVKYCCFVHHRLILYINMLLQLVSFIYMLLTRFNCYAGPRDSRVLTSSSLIKRLVRACVPRWSQMLPPKLYLVVFIKWSWWTGQG